MKPHKRLIAVMRDALIEVFVLIVADLRLGQCPQGGGLVDVLPLCLTVFRLFTHPDREADVIGIATDQRTDGPGIEKFFL